MWSWESQTQGSFLKTQESRTIVTCCRKVWECGEQHSEFGGPAGRLPEVWLPRTKRGTPDMQEGIR